MNIYLVDDNDDFRETLKFFLEDYLSHKVVGESKDGKTFLERDDIFADIILMDINMPEINGIQATKMGTWKNHEYKIIAVSQYKENVDLHQLISVGFKGFVSKVNLFRDLESALEDVYGGKLFFPEEINFTKKNP